MPNRPDEFGLEAAPPLLSFIVERLAAVMRPDYIRVWLLKPNATMADDKPIDLIARGKCRSVSRGVAALENTPVS